MEKLLINVDRPITTVDEDIFSRAYFAERVAQMLLGWNEGEGLSIALYGDGGSGKTSLLNLIDGALLKLIKGSKKKNITVVKFNPWFVGGGDKLYPAFFKLLAGTFKANNIKKSAAVAEEIIRYARATDVLEEPGMQSSNKQVDIFDDEADIFALKLALDEAIKNCGQNIIFLIDDIDKLEPIDIRRLFLLIKSKADFPGVKFLLTFDDKYVARALSKGDLSFGWQELDKLIQVGFDIPRVYEEQIGDFYFSSLFEMLDEYNISESERRELINLYHAGMKKSFTNLRHVKRLLSSLAFHLPIVAGEVSLTDFIVLDFLRVFHGDVYFKIYDNRKYLTGATDSGFKGANAQIVEDAILSLWQDTDRDKMTPVKTVCTRIFPRVAYVFEGKEYGGRFELGWIKQKRICSEQYIDKYFTFAPRTGKLTDRDFELTLEKVIETGDVKVLLPLVEKGTIADYFNRLVWVSDEQKIDNIPTLVKTAFTAGDKIQINVDETQQLPSACTADYVCWWLLRQLSVEQQVEIVKEVFDESISLETALLYLRDRVLPEAESLQGIYDTEQIESLKRSALRALKTAVKSDELLKNPEMIMLLFVWRMIAGIEEPSKFVSRCARDPETAPALIRQFSVASHKLSDTAKYITRGGLTFDFGALAVFIELDQLSRAIKRHYKASDNKKEKKLYENFTVKYRRYIDAQSVAPPPSKGKSVKADAKPQGKTAVVMTKKKDAGPSMPPPKRK